MAKGDQNPVPPEWPNGAGQSGIPKFDDHGAASLVLLDLDYDSQIAAIHHLLKRNRRADDELLADIKRIEESAQRTRGLRNEQAVDEWTDHLNAAVFQDAAHSMAAVGMLAPLIESIFYQAFQGIRRHYREAGFPSPSHSRWQQPAEDQWDCHFVWNKGRRSKKLVEGIMQLAEATTLSTYLPTGLLAILDALFEYRNKMFHCGFEWPVEERVRFQARIIDAKWPADWFAKATIGEKPWIFYLTDTFINLCLATVDEIIAGIGAFCNKELLRV